MTLGVSVLGTVTLGTFEEAAGEVVVVSAQALTINEQAIAVLESQRIPVNAHAILITEQTLNILVDLIFSVTPQALLINEMGHIVKTIGWTEIPNVSTVWTQQTNTTANWMVQ